MVIAGVKAWKHGLALLGGAVAWTGHLLIAYAISEFGCVAGWGHRNFLAVSVVSWLVIGVSVAMIALAVASIYVSLQLERSGPHLATADADERSTVEYVGRFGRIVNWLFLFVIVVETLPIFFYLDHC
jgi:hypothetical protein